MKKLIYSLPVIVIAAAIFLVSWFKTVFEESHWQDEQVNLILSSEEMTAVVALKFKEKKLNGILLPNSLYLSVPHGLGDYSLGAVYHLGEIEGKGEELIKESLRNLLAMPIDGVIREEGWAFSEGKIGVQLENLFWQALVSPRKSGVFTNFTFLDILRFYFIKVKSFGENLTNLEETDILGGKELADKSKVYEADLEKLDMVVKKSISERKIEEEGREVSILNSTGHDALAGEFARLVNNMGGRVISLGNDDSYRQESLIRYADEETGKSYTLRRIEIATGFRAERGELSDGRSQIQIVLGEDYWESVK